MQINKNSKILKRQQENKQGKQNKTKWAKTMVKQFTEEEKTLMAINSWKDVQLH